jgi:hypothetical protein
MVMVLPRISRSLESSIELFGPWGYIIPIWVVSVSIREQKGKAGNRVRAEENRQATIPPNSKRSS